MIPGATFGYGEAARFAEWAGVSPSTVTGWNRDDALAPPWAVKLYECWRSETPGTPLLKAFIARRKSWVK